MFDSSSDSGSDFSGSCSSSGNDLSIAESHESSDNNTPVLLLDNGMFRVFEGEVGSGINFVTPL